MKQIFIILVVLISLNGYAKELTEKQKQEVHDAFKGAIMESMNKDHTLIEEGDDYAVFEKKSAKIENLFSINIGDQWHQSYENVNDYERLYHYRLNKDSQNKKVFEMLTLSAFPDMKTSVEDYKGLLNAHSLLRDLNAQFVTIEQDFEAQFPYATWVLFSPKSSQNKKGEVMLYKLMKHEDTMYLLIKLWRTKSWRPKKKSRISQDLIDQWVEVFKGQWSKNVSNSINMVHVKIND